jgi:hypothetical protein
MRKGFSSAVVDSTVSEMDSLVPYDSLAPEKRRSV